MKCKVCFTCTLTHALSVSQTPRAHDFLSFDVVSGVAMDNIKSNAEMTVNDVSKRDCRSELH